MELNTFWPLNWLGSFILEMCYFLILVYFSYKILQPVQSTRVFASGHLNWFVAESICWFVFYVNMVDFLGVVHCMEVLFHSAFGAS